MLTLALLCHDLRFIVILGYHDDRTPCDRHVRSTGHRVLADTGTAGGRVILDTVTGGGALDIQTGGAPGNRQCS